MSEATWPRAGQTERAAAGYLGTNVGLLGPVRLGWQERHAYFDAEVGDLSLPRAEQRYGRIAG